MAQANKKIRVLVWNENIHEQRDQAVKNVYENRGMHEWIKDYLDKDPMFEVTTMTLDDEITEENMKNIDVTIWWGHAGHNLVLDEFVDVIQKRVLEGMGIIFLHSGHLSKPFRRLMGTSCGITWREAGEREIMWICNPYHPIMKDIDPCVIIEHCEMYGEVFDIPTPDDVLMISNFEGGEVFRSLCTFHRGRGKVVYLRPGHETFPIYKGEDDGSLQVLKIISNSCKWSYFAGNLDAIGIGSAFHQKWHIAPIQEYDFEALEAHPEENLKKK